MDRSKVSRRTADQAAELIDAGLVDADLPGGRALSGRVGPAVPRRRRRTCRTAAASRWCRCTSRAPGKILRKGAKRPTPAHVRVTFGTPLRAGGRREHHPLRRAHRAGRGRAGRRGHHRLVAVAAPRRRRHHPAAHRARRARLAARRGPSATAPASAAARPATGRSSKALRLARSARAGSCTTTATPPSIPSSSRICPPW